MKAIHTTLSLISLSLISLSQACSISKDEKAGEVIEIVLDNLIKNDLSTVGFKIENTELIPLETNPECLIDDVKKIIPYQGEYYIQTNTRLLKFSEDGNFITQIGKRGNGPGEYLMLNNFCMFQDSIYLFDGAKEKIIISDLNGHYGREINDVPNIKFAIDIVPFATKEALIAYGINFDNQDDLYAVWNSNEPKNVIPIMDTALVSSGNYSYSNHPISKSGDTILFFSPFGNKIYEYAYADKRISTVIEIEGVGYETDQTNKYPEILSAALSDGRELILNIFTLNNFIIINLYTGSIVLNKAQKKGSFLESNTYKPEESVVPFYPLFTSYSSGNTIITIKTAAEFTDIDDSNDSKIMELIKNNNLTAESNPVIVKYTINQ